MTNTPVSHIGGLDLGDEIIALTADPLPVIYFEEAPSLSHINGVIGITLATIANVPSGEPGGIKRIAGIAAILKCNVAAAIALRNALNNALLLAAPAENPEGKPS